jgi:hypothetical protein
MNAIDSTYSILHCMGQCFGMVLVQIDLLHAGGTAEVK